MTTQRNWYIYIHMCINMYTYSWEFVACVANKHASFAHSTVSNSHTFYELWNTGSHWSQSKTPFISFYFLGPKRKAIQKIKRRRRRKKKRESCFSDLNKVYGFWFWVREATDTDGLGLGHMILFSFFFSLKLGHMILTLCLCNSLQS